MKFAFLDDYRGALSGAHACHVMGSRIVAFGPGSSGLCRIGSGETWCFWRTSVISTD